jgi:hypothetical protein
MEELSIHLGAAMLAMTSLAGNILGAERDSIVPGGPKSKLVLALSRGPSK